MKKFSFDNIYFRLLLTTSIFLLSLFVIQNSVTNIVHETVETKKEPQATFRTLPFKVIGSYNIPKSTEGKQSQAQEKGFTIEFKKTAEIKDAEELIEKLADQHIDAYYTPLKNNGKVIYRIRTGLFKTRILAENQLHNIAKTYKEVMTIKEL